jgi:hypothetical protein
VANADIVLSFIRRRGAGGVTNADIVSGTGIKPHQQVFQITRSLLKSGRIAGRLFGSEWRFYPESVDRETKVSAVQASAVADREDISPPSKFEELCRKVMSAYFKKELRPRHVARSAKKFDLVSNDDSVCGDAKYFTLVRGERLPSAKFSIISEHIWLLENSGISSRFLVFGNDPRVPALWLKKYGHIKRSVEFFFLSDDGQLEKIG